MVFSQIAELAALVQEGQVALGGGLAASLTPHFLLHATSRVVLDSGH